MHRTGEPQDRVASTGPGPGRLMIGRGNVDATERLGTRDVGWEQVRSVPPRRRAALVLRTYEELSEVETAALLGLLSAASVYASGYVEEGRKPWECPA